jgi:hypothetical protein
VYGEEGMRLGPWQFRFQLPVAPARVATGQLVAEREVSLRVRVVAAPSETRLHLTVEDARGRVWNPLGVRLEAGGRSYRPSWGSCPDGACTLAAITDAIPGDPSTWVVRIDELVLVRQDLAPRETIEGPWLIRVVE